MSGLLLSNVLRERVKNYHENCYEMKFGMQFTMNSLWILGSDAWDGEATLCITVLPSDVLVPYYQMHYVHISKFTIK